jgi:serine/threonine protein kinase
MERVTGPDLRERLESEGPLPVAEVLAVAEGVARGLEAIHASGVVHRDIKPHNVMLTADGQVKIADFGLARARESGHTLTRTNLGMGTLAYVAPEQAADARRAGPPADLYGLGATLYHALGGRAPFEQERIEDLLDAITDREPTPIRELRPDCPAKLARLVDRLLSKDPEERHASATILLKRLARLREALGAE